MYFRGSNCRYEKIDFATTQLNPELGQPYFFLCKNHKPQPQTTNRIPLYLSSYTTKVNQIQYATLFQPNQKIHAKINGSKKLPKFSKFYFEPILNQTRKFMHRTIISFVQPQSNSIQNINNPIGCGIAPGNLVNHRQIDRQIYIQ